ncbi:MULTISPECIES: EF-hand domain-containing protein [Stenotrophomonas]|uniref:EF-hand domain-containing protein n=1 Tax=Stenotrophomonas TaxID=40323 RepID=UPI0026E55B24|nr:EF-hand domain-containing protein [Stenotrophomonas sp. 704A1]
MIRTPLLLALLLGTSASGIALAADAPTAPAPRPAKLDSNGDGVIDRSEAAANPRLAAAFDTLDKNKDGKLSRDEMPRWKHGRRGGHGGERWAKLDANKDGRISRDEAKADPRLAERFDQLDVNKDGYLDKADRELRRKQHRDAWFAAADSNRDGQLSKAEFDAAKGPMHRGPRHGAAPKPQR